jgi:hypothetical protein
MKFSIAAVVLSLSAASAFSASRSSLRSLGQKTVSANTSSRKVEPQMKMEGKHYHAVEIFRFLVERDYFNPG